MAFRAVWELRCVGTQYQKWFFGVAGDLVEKTRQPISTEMAQARKGRLFRDYVEGRGLAFKMATVGS